MKFIIFIIPFLSVIYSCTDNIKQSDTNISQEKFDKIKWRTKDDNNYPYRENMLNDLVYNVKLKGLKQNEVLVLLGLPDRIDSSYLFYRVAEKRIGFFPLSTKTLVIKLTKDSIVEWRKIHG
jgi:hypothetical protein